MVLVTRTVSHRSFSRGHPFDFSAVSERVEVNHRAKRKLEDLEESLGDQMDLFHFTDDPQKGEPQSADQYSLPKFLKGRDYERRDNGVNKCRHSIRMNYRWLQNTLALILLGRTTFSHLTTLPS